MDRSTFDDRLKEDFQWPKEGFPWPDVGDELFSQGHPLHAAFLEHHSDHRFYHMAKGYKIAADLLVEHAEAGGSSKGRHLVYPIIFCYRHFLELTLKTMLKKYGPMADIELENLWGEFRKILDSLDAEGSAETTDVVSQCVAEFAKNYPGSQAFRYPTGKKGQSFNLDLHMIDLSYFHGTMQKIDTYFMCVDGYLGQIKESQRDDVEILIALYPTDY